MVRQGGDPKFCCTCGQEGKGLLHSEGKRKRWQSTEWPCRAFVLGQLSGAKGWQSLSPWLGAAAPGHWPPPRQAAQSLELPPGALGRRTQCGCAERPRKGEGNFTAPRGANVELEKPRGRAIRRILPQAPSASWEVRGSPTTRSPSSTERRVA